MIIYNNFTYDNKFSNNNFRTGKLMVRIILQNYHSGDLTGQLNETLWKKEYV